MSTSSSAHQDTPRTPPDQRIVPVPPSTPESRRVSPRESRSWVFGARSPTPPPSRYSREGRYSIDASRARIPSLSIKDEEIWTAWQIQGTRTLGGLPNVSNSAETRGSSSGATDPSESLPRVSMEVPKLPIRSFASGTAPRMGFFDTSLSNVPPVLPQSTRQTLRAYTPRQTPVPRPSPSVSPGPSSPRALLASPLIRAQTPEQARKRKAVSASSEDHGDPRRGGSFYTHYSEELEARALNEAIASLRLDPNLTDGPEDLEEREETMRNYADKVNALLRDAEVHLWVKDFAAILRYYEHTHRIHARNEEAIKKWYLRQSALYPSEWMQFELVYRNHQEDSKRSLAAKHAKYIQGVIKDCKRQMGKVKKARVGDPAAR